MKLRITTTELVETGTALRRLALKIVSSDVILTSTTTEFNKLETITTSADAKLWRIVRILLKEGTGLRRIVTKIKEHRC